MGETQSAALRPRTAGRRLASIYQLLPSSRGKARLGYCEGVATAAELAGGDAAVTRQTVFPTSSAMSTAPVRSGATPTGRPFVWASSETKPVTTSWGGPLGRPSRKGT